MKIWSTIIPFLTQQELKSVSSQSQSTCFSDLHMNHLLELCTEGTRLPSGWIREGYRLDRMPGHSGCREVMHVIVACHFPDLEAHILQLFSLRSASSHNELYTHNLHTTLEVPHTDLTTLHFVTWTPECKLLHSISKQFPLLTCSLEPWAQNEHQNQTFHYMFPQKYTSCYCVKKLKYRFISNRASHHLADDWC